MIFEYLIDGMNNELSLKQGESECIVRTNIDLNPELSDQGHTSKVYFFVKEDVIENDIYPVSVGSGSETIGWMIPYNALFSTDHEYGYNPIFQKVAYLAFEEIFRRMILIVGGSAEQVDINEFFNDDTCILMISEERLDQFNIELSLEKVAPYLLSYGYVPVASISDLNKSEVKIVKTQSIDVQTLSLKLASDDISNLKLIVRLMTESVSIKNTSLFKFFYLYQIVELLMEQVYSDKHEMIVDDLNAVKGSLIETKNVLKKINNLASDDTRMALLSNEFCKLKPSELEGLKNSCNELLQVLIPGEERAPIEAADYDTANNEKDEFKYYLYKIRNFVFHQYGNVSEEESNLQKLEKIVNEFFLIVPIMLIRYKKSTVIDRTPS